MDMFAVFLSICLAYGLRVYLENMIAVTTTISLESYTANILLYAVVAMTFLNEKIYNHRFDFWEETYLIIRGVVVSLVLVLSILALTKSMGEYSRFVIVVSFLLMCLFIPISKNITKKFLFRVGLWKRRAEVCGHDDYLQQEVFNNPYLGYVHTNQTDAQTIFIDTKNITAGDLQERLDTSLREKKEVLFIPLLQSYNFSNARIIELSNARKNLIVLENSLLKRSNILIKKGSDLIFSVILVPFLLVIIAVIAFLMKKEEPTGSIFFKQTRMGKNGKTFLCYKFRSMYENSDEILEAYLKEHPDEIVCYDEFHKYKNDPRITKVGRILRKTSLDELPQVLNVLKGEMSLIGPRPYMPNERKKIANNLNMVLAVEPGITGLWQVSGRNELDFKTRVDIDVWYTRNWNLWLDLVILVKTIKVVLFRSGAS